MYDVMMTCLTVQITDWESAIDKQMQNRAANINKRMNESTEMAHISVLVNGPAAAKTNKKSKANDDDELIVSTVVSFKCILTQLDFVNPVKKCVAVLCHDDVLARHVVTHTVRGLWRTTSEDERPTPAVQLEVIQCVLY